MKVGSSTTPRLMLSLSSGRRSRAPERKLMTPRAGAGARGWTSRPFAHLRLADHEVVAGVRAGGAVVVDLHQVGRAEPLRPGAAEGDAGHGGPRGGDARHLGGRVDIGEVLDAAGELEVELLDQRDVHLGADEGHEQLGEGRIDVAHAIGVGQFAGAGDVAAVEHAGHGIGEGDRAVDARVAVVVERLAPPLDAGGDAEVAAGKREQIVAADLGVGQRKAGAALAGHVDAEGLDRGGGIGRAVAEARIVEAPAVERVVGVGRRQVDLPPASA